MEHRLIRGGIQYLPFARSRIKALRATGQTYATQRFLFADAELRVEICGEQEYIYLTGSACIQRMDSGVVEVYTAAGIEPDRYRTGKLYEAGSAVAYHAPYADHSPVTDYKIKSTAGGQVAGRTSRKGSAFTARVPYDAQDARSFSPKAIQTSVDPVAYGLDPADDALYGKKVVATTCPPSIFTGRCRLWVQAMYGQPTNDDNHEDAEGNITGAGAATLPAQPALGPASGNTTPFLLVAAALPRPDKTLFDPIDVNTGSGVHLDAHGNHWLFTVSVGGVTVYPLVAIDCVEQWRSFLDPQSASYSKVDATDRAHIEAYVLAHSRPDANRVQEIEGLLEVALWSMGYSWHWNWTGLVADIVTNIQVVSGPFTRSSHYRLTMAASESAVDGVITTTWSAGKVKISGPTDWGVYRQLWVLTEPDWASGNLAKISAVAEVPLEAVDAPFYAFYLGDVLQLCTLTIASATTTGGQTSGATTTGLNPDPEFYPDLLTVGLRGGWGYDMSASGAYYTCSFKIGEAEYSDMPSSFSQSGTMDVVSEKTKYGQNSGYMTVGTGIDIQSGYPYPYELIKLRSSIGLQAEYAIPLTVRYYLTHSSVSRNTRSAGVVVVPFKDSEAVFVRAQTYTTETITGTVRKLMESNYFGYETRVRYQIDTTNWTGWSSYYKTYVSAVASSGATISTDNPADVTTTNTTMDDQVLLCRAGEVDAPFTNLDQFHDNDRDDVAATFATLSGVDPVTPVVIANNYVTPPIGLSAEVAMPVIVGWV